MALIQGSITARAATAQAKIEYVFAGWPPLFPTQMAAPSSTSLDDPYPLLDPITPLEVVSADKLAVGDGLGPENRVAVMGRNRTDLLRGYVNLLSRLANLLPENFLDRDGIREGEEISDTTYMRGPFDVGTNKIVNLLAGSDSNDLVNFAQLKVVLFDYEDRLDEANQTLWRLDGSNAMSRRLDMGAVSPGNRIINLGAPSLASHAVRQTDFETQTDAFESGYLARTGVLAMTNSGAAWDLDTNPIRNAGVPLADGDAVTKAWFEAQLAVGGLAGFPIGGLLPHFGGTVPPAFLLCDGREVSRLDYPSLFATIGVTFGTPSSSTTFLLPDLRGRVPIGLDNMGGSPAGRVTDLWASTLGGVGGSSTVNLSVANLPAHVHEMEDAYAATGSGGALTGEDPADTTTALNLVSFTSVTDDIGSTPSHPNMQPSIFCLWLIRAG